MRVDKISIIIPVYKVEKYLDRCVESVVNQTYKNLEIILVDDGSPDNCPLMCDEWTKKDKRIKVIHKENGGVSSARNAGIKASTGEFIQFIDSDDYIQATYCENLIKAAKDDVDMVVSGFTIIENKKEILKTSCPSADITEIKRDIDIFFKYLKSALMSSSVNKLYRRTILGDGFTEGVPLAEDSIFVLNCLLASKNKIIMIDNVGYCYEQNMQSATHKERDDVFESYCAYWDKFYEFLNEQFKTVNHQGYYGVVFDMIFFSILRSSNCNLKKLKKQINNNIYASDCLKNFKPLNIKEKMKLFLIKRNMFKTLRFISKIKNS